MLLLTLAVFNGDKRRIFCHIHDKNRDFLLTFSDIVSRRSFSFLRDNNPHSAGYVHTTFDDQGYRGAVTDNNNEILIKLSLIHI